MLSGTFGSQVNSQDIDVIIIGAGPAGLAAAAACKAAGIQAVLLERGNNAEERDRYAPQDVGEGVGGAGLFSDGKFSFYPSATHLWELQPSCALSVAYEWVSTILRPFGIDSPPFPDSRSQFSNPLPTEGFRIKEYPSFRIPLSKRLELVQALATRCHHIRTLVDVTNMRIDGERIVVSTRSRKEAVEEKFVARAVVVATGRLGAIRLLSWLNIDSVFRRLEVGVRLEQAQDAFFLRTAKGLDPKLVGQNRPGIEWRTFCCCRGGEVVEVLSNGVLAMAGRSDVAATNRSNVAFHVRITDADLGRRILPNVISGLDQQSPSFSCHVDHIGDNVNLRRTLNQKFGPEVTEELVLGLQKLQHEYNIRGSVTVYGPAVEGIGLYPQVESNLQISALPVWLPGDVAGLFRGLTAALVSGYFVGLQCVEYICA